MKRFIAKVIAWFELVGTSRAASALAAQGLVKEAKELMLHQAKVRQTIAELNKLTDRELNDIGISRGEIYDIANSTDKLAA